MIRTNLVFFGLLGLLGAATGCVNGEQERLLIADREKPLEVALFPIEVSKGRWGFMNRSGKLVVEPRFSRACPFQGGYSVVVNDRWKRGLVDERGEYVIEAKYELLFLPSEGLVRVADGGNNKVFCYGHYGFLDLSGKVVIKPNLGYAWDFREGLAAAMEYVKIEDAMPTCRPKVGFINKKGRWVVKPQFELMSNPLMTHGFSEGLAAVKTRTGYGFIDRAGRYAIEPQFGHVGDFSDGLAPAKLTELWNDKKDLGYINKRGKFVIKPQFAVGLSFSEGLACVATGYNRNEEKPTFGYINKTGKWVIEPRFYWANSFDSGWARVRIKKREPKKLTYDLETFIDQTGKEISGDGYSYEGPFRGGVAPVIVRVAGQKRMGYVDRAGHFIWDPRRQHEATESGCMQRPPETDKEIAGWTTLIEMPHIPADVRAPALLCRGVVYSKLTPPETDKAIADWTALIEMPDAGAFLRAEALFKRGVAYGKLTPPETDKAIADWTALIEMPDARAYYRAKALLYRFWGHET